MYFNPCVSRPQQSYMSSYLLTNRRRFVSAFISLVALVFLLLFPAATTRRATTTSATIFCSAARSPPPPPGPPVFDDGQPFDRPKWPLRPDLDRRAQSHIPVAIEWAKKDSQRWNAIQKARFLGCFQDSPDVKRRTLPLAQMADLQRSVMTVDGCVAWCAARGFAYAGVEWGIECYCGDQPPAADSAGSSCVTPCAGADAGATGANVDTRSCGGELAISVYHVEDSLALTPVSGDPADPDESRPLIALVMIVKNEAHTIIDTLESVAGSTSSSSSSSSSSSGVIDAAAILDTGSTDGTQSRMRGWFAQKNIPVRIFEEPFLDYGASRNRILELAAAYIRPIFTLMLSADEQVKNPQEMRRFLERTRHSYGSMHDAYPLILHAGQDFDSVRIARVDGVWRYVGRVHEYLTSPQHAWVDLFRPLPEVRVEFSATDGDRRFNSQFFIIKVLLEDLEDDPHDERALSYLGSTYASVGNWTQSAVYWGLLADASRSKMHKFHARLQQAEAYLRIGVEEMKPDDDEETRKRKKKAEQHRIAIVNDILLQAHAHDPEQMTALHRVAQLAFDRGDVNTAYMFAREAAQIPLPPYLHKDAPNYHTQDMWVRESEYLYLWEGNRLLGFAAEAVKRWDDCVIALHRVLQVHPDDVIAASLQKHCREKLFEENPKLAAEGVARVNAQLQSAGGRLAQQPAAATLRSQKKRKGTKKKKKKKKPKKPKKKVIKKVIKKVPKKKREHQSHDVASSDSPSPQNSAGTDQGTVAFDSFQGKPVVWSRVSDSASPASEAGTGALLTLLLIIVVALLLIMYYCGFCCFRGRGTSRLVKFGSHDRAD